MDDGHVLVMPSGADELRLAPLLDKIAAQRDLTVVRGPDVGGYPSYVQEADAAALLVPIGAEAWPDPQLRPLDRFSRAGELVFVNLDTKPRSAPAVGDAAYIDLAGWTDAASPKFDQLIAHLRALLATRRDSQFISEFTTDQVNSATSGVAELQALTDNLRQIGEVLSDDKKRSRALRETLAEIGGTYRVVKGAVVDFVAAGLSPSGPDAQVYARLAHGPLAQMIRNGRGHCRRIGLRYLCVGGLRDGLRTKISPKTLADLDETFDLLANADSDVFSAMDALGDGLTNESQVIVRHLRTGRIEQARQHIAEAEERLRPLEEALDRALAAFQDVEAALGYAEPLPKTQEVQQVTTLNFYGNVNHSNIVVAQTIENSRLVVENSAAPEDLKVALVALHDATKALTSRLPADAAALAAKDLEDLTKETTSPTPRLAVWRRAAQGLVSAAKDMAEGGVAVIDLVSKVATLLGYSIGV